MSKKTRQLDAQQLDAPYSFAAMYPPTGQTILYVCVRKRTRMYPLQQSFPIHNPLNVKMIAVGVGLGVLSG